MFVCSFADLIITTTASTRSEKASNSKLSAGFKKHRRPNYNQTKNNYNYNYNNMEQQRKPHPWNGMAQDPVQFLQKDDMEGPGVEGGKGQSDFGWAFHPDKMILVSTGNNTACAPVQPCHRTGRTWRYPCTLAAPNASRQVQERVRLHNEAHKYFLLNGDTEGPRFDLEGHRNLICGMRLPTMEPGRYTPAGHRTDSQKQEDADM